MLTLNIMSSKNCLQAYAVCLMGVTSWNAVSLNCIIIILLNCVFLKAEKDVKEIYKQKSQLEKEVEILNHEVKLLNERLDEASKAAEESERFNIFLVFLLTMHITAVVDC
jgi:peptidoglycan hydrolase CwlO-like protein